MKQVEKSLEELIAAIRKSAPYTRYQRAAEQKKQHPEKEKQVNEFRKKNFALQNSSQREDLLGEIENYKRELDELNKDPMIAEYLAAELDFCRMIQRICYKIFEEVDFEVGFEVKDVY